jgi:deaminated glutathione amidase
MSTFVAAAVQMRSGTDPKANIATMQELARDAASRGATYIQTPEMTGCLMRDKAALMASLKSDHDDPVVAAASSLAAELGVWFHLGSTAIDAGEGMAANRAFVFSPDGALVTTYDKIHMFDVDLDNGESWRESATYRPGKRAVVAEIAGARFGLAICYDIRFPQLFRAQALAGAQVLTGPAAFTRQTGEAHWHVLQRARAIENGAFVISAAQGGKHEDGRETYGHSLVVDPWGRILAEADGDEPGIVLAEIDPSESAKARAKVPNLKNARDFELDTVDPASGPAVSRERSTS